MKCLLCNFQSNNQNEVRNHYIHFHRVDSKNEFFKKIFAEEKNVFYRKRCLRCQEYLPTSRFKISHNFLKHYNDSETVVDNKPITVTEVSAVKKYEITCQQHSDSYDFFNSEKLVDRFLLWVKGKIFCSNTDLYTRCGFSLENMQAPLTNDDVPLTNSCYWSTEPVQTKSFSDFIFFSFRDSILKRVSNNGLTCSSWFFKRFLYINVKTIKDSDQFIW